MFFNKNDKAVSPIVATLVLIVVAIVGAVVVGMMLGAFSGNVQDQASNGQMTTAGANSLLIGGSTTVQPLSAELSKAYMQAHPGIKITVQGGGSEQGRIGVNTNVLDIGSASSTTDTVTKYPSLIQTEIGGSCVVVIARGLTAPIETSANLISAYQNAVAGTGATPAVYGNIPVGTVVYQRSDVSGTEDTFASYLAKTTPAICDTANSNQLPAACNALGATSNGDMISKVAVGPNTLGFADHGMITDATLIMGVDTTPAGIFDKTHIVASLKAKHAGTSVPGDATHVSSDLCRNLYYLTKGQPNNLAKDFINFARQPGSATYYANVGYFSTYDYF